MHEKISDLNAIFPKVDSMAVHVENILEATIPRVFCCLFQLKTILVLLASYAAGDPRT